MIKIKNDQKGNTYVCTFENMALGMAKTYLHFATYEGSEALYRRIEALTAKELWDISNELLTLDNLTTLIYR